MIKYNYTFKSESSIAFNDQILPGAAYLIEGHEYEFSINPKSLFWRFGIRFSKHREVNFVTSGDRHIQNGSFGFFRDLHLAVGERSENDWVKSNVLSLAQYNFSTTLRDHLLAVEHGYHPREKVKLRLSYDSKSDRIILASLIGERLNSKNSIPSEGYRYFKIFAWADFVPFELDCTVQVKPTVEEEIRFNPVAVGNIVFRLGDMFDSYVRKECNVILLPASTNGTATSNVLKRAQELGIPPPKKSAPGQVSFFSSKEAVDFRNAGYAYSVEDQQSNSELLSILCSSILHAVNQFNHLSCVSLPVLGSGTGGIDPVDVSLIYDGLFNGNENERAIPFMVSVQSEKAFWEIKQRMHGKYIPLPNEEFLKPENILFLEKRLRTQIDHRAYSIDENGKVYELMLYSILSENLDFLDLFPELQLLTLRDSKIFDFTFLPRLHKLQSLTLIDTEFEQIDLLSRIKELETLEIRNGELSDIAFLSDLKQLKHLTISQCSVDDISGIEKLHRLIYLDLSNNQISDITPLSSLINASHLILSANQIFDIAPLVELEELEYLDLSHNKLYDISTILQLEKLEFVTAHGNPYLEGIDLILHEGENHLPTIKGLLLRQKEENTEEVVLPVKILLLGNHASGKSSFLHYFFHDNLDASAQSTHIIKIENYPRNTELIPKAIFFDFGGQDYYHGIYRAFLTAGALYLILWNKANNQNQKRPDSNNIVTQDFTIRYWLSQKQYFEQQKYDGAVDPIFLVQTHSDIDNRNSLVEMTDLEGLENVFYVSLLSDSLPPRDSFQRLNECALKYLKESVLALIDKGRSSSMEPVWYIDFINYILIQSRVGGYMAQSVQKDVLPYYKRSGNNKTEFLENDLIQLHRRGLILYYSEEGMHDHVWLNPVAMVTYIHSSVLTKERNSNYKGRIPVKNFDNIPSEIIQLLRLQKVIFKHEHADDGSTEYIIPNFLPLADEDSNYDMLAFGLATPTFVLKFKNFFPFGIINQLICHFGDLPEKKKFWRDRLVFTFKNAKVLIHVDFQLLEIRVSCAFSHSHDATDKSDLQSYLFYSILAVYWDFKKILDYNDFRPYFKSGLKNDGVSLDEGLYFEYEDCKALYEKQECRPNDLYISLDDSLYINYVDLCSDEGSALINCKTLGPDRVLLDCSKTIPIYPFQLFTKRTLKRRKKVAISYSTRDVKLVNKFRDHLVALYDDEVIEDPFQCIQLIAGQEWSEEIQRRFNEADIIFFMISENLMATKYVKEVEIKNAVDRRETDKSFRIIPIVLVPCHWSRKGKYDLSQFTALPFKAQPVTAFKDQNEAWFCAIELIRIMIDKDLHPENSDVVLSAAMKKIQEEYFTQK